MLMVSTWATPVPSPEKMRMMTCPWAVVVTGTPHASVKNSSADVSSTLIRSIVGGAPAATPAQTRPARTRTLTTHPRERRPIISIPFARASHPPNRPPKVNAGPCCGGGVINGCYKSQNGQQRLIDPATDHCPERDGDLLEPDRPQGPSQPTYAGSTTRIGSSSALCPR